MKFVLKVSGGGDAVIVDGAIVFIDAKERESLLRRKAIFLGVKAYEPELLYTEYWDGIDWAESFQDDELSAAVWDKELVTDPVDFRHKSLRVECETCLVDERGAHWTCLVKHTEVRLETSYIPWDLIEAPE
jgi:hypothetical protein